MHFLHLDSIDASQYEEHIEENIGLSINESINPIDEPTGIYIYIYTGCPLKKVGATVGAQKKSRRTKKSYTILPISQ